MKKMTWLILAALVFGSVPAAFAADTPTGSVPVAAPAKAVTAPAPKVTSTEGSITAIDVQSAAPNLSVTGADGKAVAIQIDKLLTSVWKGTQKLTLAELKSGDKVKVRHTTKDGKEVAKTIEVI